MKARKWILRVVLGLVALVVIILVVTWLMIDTLGRKGVKHGGEYALGVPTDVQDFSLSLVNGSLTMDKLTVANPSGFTSPHLLETGRFDVQVQPSSVLGSPVVVQRFLLDGLDVNIEQAGGKNNISTVLANVRQQFGSTASGSPPSGGGESGAKQPAAQPAVNDQGGGKKVKISQITIRNVVAHVSLGLGGKPLTITVPEIELTDVSSDDNGATVSAVIGKIMPAILASIVKSGANILPADLAGVLNQDLASTAGAMGANATKMLQQAGGQAAALAKEGGKFLQQPGLAATQSIPKLGGGMKLPASLPSFKK